MSDGAAPMLSAIGAARLKLLVGQYNLLCPTYGLKWGEREACREWKSKTEHGGSNWPERWPALRRVLCSASWDLLTLQELEDTTCADVLKALGDMGLGLVYFEHPGRQDAIGIAYNAATFTLQAKATREYPQDAPYATTGRVDLCHVATGTPLRVLVTHQKGGNAAQLDDLFAFAAADELASGGVTLVCGDFNEDFGGAAASLRPGFTTLLRGADEPAVSRPPHKQADDQTSGKGKVDYIFASASGQCTLARDQLSRKAIALSHSACEATGEWPSDHGIEALTVCVDHGGFGFGRAQAESAGARQQPPADHEAAYEAAYEDALRDAKAAHEAEMSVLESEHAAQMKEAVASALAGALEGAKSKLLEYRQMEQEANQRVATLEVELQAAREGAAQDAAKAAGPRLATSRAGSRGAAK